MTDETDLPTRADEWLFKTPRDESEKPRDVMIDRVIKDRRRSEANWKAVKTWATRIAGGTVVGTFLYNIAEKVDLFK